MPRAEASHILVKTEAEALELKQKIADGASFADLAKQHSSCPSGQAGGSLGEFSQGQMVPEFETAAGDAEFPDPVLVPARALLDDGNRPPDPAHCFEIAEQDHRVGQIRDVDR